MQKPIDIQKTVEAIHNNPVAPGATAVGTIGIGVATWADILSNVAGGAAALAGCTLTILLCIKEYLKIRDMKNKTKEVKERMKKGLPCGRCGELEAVKKLQKEDKHA